TDAGGTLAVPLTSIDTDDQDASEVTYDNTTSGLTATDTQAAIDEIAAAGGGNPLDELNTTFAVNAGNLEITDAGGTLAVPLTSIDTDDQDASEVTYDNTTSGLTATDTQAAIDEIAAAGGGNPLDELNTTFAVNAGNLEITDAGGTLAVPLTSIDTDDQTDAEVLLATPSDYDGNAINETTVEEALDALSAVSGAHVGTPNSIFFADSGGLPTEDNDSFYWDPAARLNSGGLFIGIDGNTPTTVAKVHIMEEINNSLVFPIQMQNNAQSTTSGVGMLFSVDLNTARGKGALAYQRSGTSGIGDFHFLQNTTTGPDYPTLADAVVTIKNDGDMGIGTTTPAEKLHVNGNLQLDGNLIAQNGAGNLNDVLTITAAGTEWAPAGAGGVNLSNTNLQQTAATNRTYDINGGNIAFTGSGNFGIGNAANPPTNKLHVAGTIRSEGGFLSSDGNANEPAFRFNSDTNTGMYSAAANQLALTTNGFEALRIDDNQNVGVGTASPTSTLATGGSFATAIETTTGNTSLDENDHTVILGGNHTINLPNASNCQGRVYIIKNPTLNITTIDNYIDNTGAGSVNIQASSVLWLQSDGTNWQQIN
ncbi:hypothetical protein J1G40_15230, partial [Muriicola sp. Z0-33]